MGHRATKAAKHWILRPQNPELGAAIAQALGVSPVTAQVLVNRGMRTPDEARAFLRPELDHLHDARLLPDMDAAVERIRRALRAREPIVIFGDYDVDGLTSAALLHHFFRFLGASPHTIIPHRLDEGYGLSDGALSRLPASGGLLVSVDTGIGSVGQVEQMRARGIDVVITDHHEQTGALPRAIAVVNPKRSDSAYPFRDLAGVGVAFKLVSAIADRLSPARKQSDAFRRFLLDALALVALGTIADVAPLVGENRVLATFGLRALESCANPGIRALVEIVGLDSSRLETPHVGFRLGPRLNAAGRMGSADVAFRLLTAESPEEARELAARLDAENERRQDVERRLLASVRRRVESPENAELRDAPILVVWDDEWHPGVIGIVAAKAVDLYEKPVVVISAAEGRCRGSARAPRGFDLLAAIEAGAPHLSSYGGHARAAGFEIERDRIPEFARTVVDAARAIAKRSSEPSLDLDLEVAIDVATPTMVAEIERLSPFGERNPAPLFAATDVRIAGSSGAGVAGKRGAFVVEQNGTSRRAILHPLLDAQALPDPLPPRVDLVFTPRIARGKRGAAEPAALAEVDAVELLVRDLRAAS
jgi:single-stranded-DNA-specific exonuclease